MPNRGIAGKEASKPQYRKKPKPHPAARVPVDHHERKQVEHEARGGDKYGVNKAVKGLGKATSGAADTVYRAAQAGPIHRALVDKPVEHHGLLHGDLKALSDLKHIVGSTYDPGYRHIPEIPQAARDAWAAIQKPGPAKYEKTTDTLAGKSLSNLLFHGDTSHLPEAGLEAGALLPIGRGFRAVDELVSAGRVAKKAQGVADVLPAAKKARAAQEAGYSAERAKRFKNVDPAFAQAGGGRAGLHAATGELKGELPKVDFGKLREGGYSPQELDRDINRIFEHPDLKRGEAIHAAKGLENMFVDRVTPQDSQIRLLNKVFGVEQTKELVKRSLGDRVWDVLGASRSLKSSLDMSATLRQLLVVLARHPVAVTKGVVPAQLKTVFSGKNYQALIDSIHASPDYAEMHDVAKLKFTELHPTKIRAREEMYPSPWIEKPLRVKGVDVNVPGYVVRASGRAFTAARDVALMAAYQQQKRLMVRAGVDVTDPTQLRAIGKVLNSATGRGELGKAESWAPALNAIFFAPSLAKSRIDFLNPIWYAKLRKESPYAARQAARSMVHLGAAVTGVLAAGVYLTGGRVGHDPRSADFAKLKLGDSRLDPLGGFQQYLRLAAQLTPEKVYGGDTWQGVTISSATGRRKKMGTGFGDPTRLDSLLTFLQSKANPPVGMFLDVSRGTDLTGNKISAQKEALGMVTPLVMQDAYDLYHNTQSAKFAAIGYLVSGLGVGLQTYGNPTDKKAGKDFKSFQSEVQKSVGYMPQNLLRAYKARALVTKLEDGRQFSDSKDPRHDEELKRDKAHLLLNAIGQMYPNSQVDVSQADSVPYEKLDAYNRWLMGQLDPQGVWKQWMEWKRGHGQ